MAQATVSPIAPPSERQAGSRVRDGLLIVSAALMALGMMMVPPPIVSLPFMLLLFVVVDGWALITTALVGSYGGAG